ncbi:MAG: DinB family protein [Phycisphaerae bacterium]
MGEIELLVQQLVDTREWTLKLTADLDGDDWHFQPAPGVAHALWLGGHLATAQDTLIHQRCLARCVLDTDFREHFPIGGPVKSVTQHDYPRADNILAVMADVHSKTCDAVRGMSTALLDEPAFGADGKTPHPHYSDKRGAVSHAIRHEAFHAGQLAWIRRLLGKPFLR